MSADAERNRLRALAERPWALAPQPAEPLNLFCERCGAEFTATALARECPHCNVIGATDV